jgi:hypothetical protein
MRAPQRREESRERPLLLLRSEAGGHQGGHRERRRGREEEEERGGEDGERWENRMAMAAAEAMTAERVHQLPLRSTSIRLRRRRDQAKQEFLQNRRSGEFGYHSTDLDWGGGGGGGEKEVFREPLHNKPLASSSPRQLFESRSDIADNRRRGGIRRQLGNSSAAGPVEYTHFGLIDTPPPSASAVMEMLGGEQPASLPVTGGEHRNLSLRKGLLWMQRDRLFSRWKERFVILTQDTLYTFKKAVSSIAEMGQFLIKVSARKKRPN